MQSIVSLNVRPQLRSIMQDRGVKDHLHHLWNIGIMGVPHRHAKVKAWEKAVVVLMERIQMENRRLP